MTSLRSHPALRAGYRSCAAAGRFVVRVADGKGGSWTKVVGIADDFEVADGEHVLTWWQAIDKPHKLTRSRKTFKPKFAAGRVFSPRPIDKRSAGLSENPVENFCLEAPKFRHTRSAILPLGLFKGGGKDAGAKKIDCRDDGPGLD